ncbi:MAG: YeeE/YedE family protein [Syntrophales bacterium]|jgi:uncharacterized membrane protein YedE/YeeE|nr:YeeE/YedE family protein [Syntrophales bacterium]MDY0045260.1 YeeE/YedE thiosulfate transporter family protein [Syntrophales bacterium]
MKRDTIGKILLGAGTGMIFGFLLHKGRAADPGAISGQLHASDSSVFKIMATASAVGAAGAHILNRSGLAPSTIKPLNTRGILLGGTAFGAGMAMLGYCPGTGMAALGAGHKDAATGALGMVAGAAAYITLYPKIKTLLEKGDAGAPTLPELTGTNPLLWVAGMAAATAAVAVILERDSTREIKT